MRLTFSSTQPISIFGVINCLGKSLLSASLICNSLHKQLLPNTHAMLSFLSLCVAYSYSPSSMNQPLCGLHCALAPGLCSTGRRRSWEERFASLGCSICRAQAGGCPRAAPPEPPAAPAASPVVQLPGVSGEPSGSCCLFLDILDSSIYLGSPRSQSQRSASHLDSSARGAHS